MKDEILFVSNYQKQSDIVLKNIADKLMMLGIQFDLRMRECCIETEKHKIYAVSMNSPCLTIHNSFTKYYVIGFEVDIFKFNDIFHFREDARQLFSLEEIIEIVRCAG